jgi:hypothetical protein
MTYFYQTYVGSQGETGISSENRNLWEHIAQKKNWRIVKLPNGFFQSEYFWGDEWNDVTRRATIESCEQAIDASIEYYKKRLEPEKKPVVVKTFQ